MAPKSREARAHTDRLVDRAIEHLRRQAANDQPPALPAIDIKDADRLIDSARRLAFTSARGKRPEKEATANLAAAYAAAEIATHHRITYPDRGSFQEREDQRSDGSKQSHLGL